MPEKNGRKLVSMKQGSTVKKPSPRKRESTRLAEEARRREAAFRIIQEDRRKGRRSKQIEDGYQPKHQKGK